MDRPRLARIVATFVAVFALGGVTGWKLCRSAGPAMTGVARIEVSAEGALAKLSERLGLTPEQETQLRPVFVEWSREAGRAGRDQRRRLELFEQNLPRIRPGLTEAQHVAFDRLVTEARQRFEKRRLPAAGSAAD